MYLHTNSYTRWGLESVPVSTGFHTRNHTSTGLKPAQFRTYLCTSTRTLANPEIVDLGMCLGMNIRTCPDFVPVDRNMGLGRSTDMCLGPESAVGNCMVGKVHTRMCQDLEFLHLGNLAVLREKQL